MEKVWLKSYPPGVPAEIDLQGIDTLKKLLASVCEKFSGHTAFGNLGATLSYSEVDTLSRHFGALRAGCVVVNVNPLYTARREHGPERVA